MDCLRVRTTDLPQQKSQNVFGHDSPPHEELLMTSLDEKVKPSSVPSWRLYGASLYICLSGLMTTL